MLSMQGKGFQAGLVMRGMSSTWCNPPVIHTLEAQATTGLLGNMHVFCARLWSRLLLSQNATGTGKLPLIQTSSPDVKAEAVDGYVRYEDYFHYVHQLCLELSACP